MPANPIQVAAIAALTGARDPDSNTRGNPSPRPADALAVRRVTVWLAWALSLLLVLIVSIATPPAASAQETAGRNTTPRWSLPPWLRRGPAKEPRDASHAETARQTEPTPLRVIDRATARQQAPMPPANQGVVAGGNRYTPPAARGSVGDLAPATAVPGNVHAASYQQPPPRVYQTPPNDPSAHLYDPYDPAVVIAPGWIDLPGGGVAPYPPAFLPGDPTHSQAPGHWPPQQTGNAGMEGSSVLPRDYPELNSPAPPIQDYTQPSHVPPAQPWDQRGPADLSGRGYLQGGPALHGRRLGAAPLTATERALELQDENQRLRETLTRTQLELNNRMQELAQAQAAADHSAQELQQALLQVKELTKQVIRLTEELNQALEERNAVERRMNEQLKAIEHKLDSVLMNSFSDRGGQP